MENELSDLVGVNGYSKVYDISIPSNLSTKYNINEETSDNEYVVKVIDVDYNYFKDTSKLKMGGFHEYEKQALLEEVMYRSIPNNSENFKHLVPVCQFIKFDKYHDDDKKHLYI